MIDAIVRVSIGLLLLATLFAPIERLFGRERSWRTLRTGWRTQVTYLFIDGAVTGPLIKFFIAVPAIVLIASGMASVEELKGRTYDGFGPIAAQPVWLQAVEIYLLADLIGYWSHRWFHGRRLWSFHAVHHATRELNWLGAVQVHPVNELLTRFLQVIPLLLVGFNPLVTASTAPVLTLYAILLHADVHWTFGPLRRVFASPVFHRWHHSLDPAARDTNFAGLFPVWDIVFGTYYFPRDRMPLETGIPEHMPAGYVGQFLHPFRQRKAPSTHTPAG